VIVALQIRVHLQHLKHPIANDVKYGGDGLIAFAHSPIKLDISCPEIPEGPAATSLSVLSWHWCSTEWLLKQNQLLFKKTKHCC
jgi:hypothetical protein